MNRDALKHVENATVTLLNENGPSRGVLVPNGMILTAAHCINLPTDFHPGFPHLEKAQAADGRELLLELLAIEFVGDIALLCSPDNQRCWDEAEAFDEFVAATPAVPLFRERWPVIAHRGVLRMPAHVFNANRQWITATASRRDGPMLALETETEIEGGASGGPVVTDNGELLGIVSFSTEQTPEKDRTLYGSASYPLQSLPIWALTKFFAATAEPSPRSRPAKGTKEIKADETKEMKAPVAKGKKGKP